MSKPTGKDKKAQILERNRKIHKILEHERIHERARQTAKNSEETPKKSHGGGGATAADATPENWQQRTMELRDRIRARRKKARGMWLDR